MIDTDELRGFIVKRGLSQAKIAKKIGITPKTFYEKMNRGVFGTDEIEIIMSELAMNPEEAIAIFFSTR